MKYYNLRYLYGDYATYDWALMDAFDHLPERGNVHVIKSTVRSVFEWDGSPYYRAVEATIEYGTHYETLSISLVESDDHYLLISTILGTSNTDTVPKDHTDDWEFQGELICAHARHLILKTIDDFEKGLS